MAQRHRRRAKPLGTFLWFVLKLLQLLAQPLDLLFEHLQPFPQVFLRMFELALDAGLDLTQLLV